MDSSIIYRISLFYILLSVGLVGLGATTVEGNSVLSLPSFPDLNPISGIDIPIIGVVSAFFFFFLNLIAFVFLLLAFMIALLGFTFLDFLPFYISIPLFTPLAIVILTEIAKLGRGTG